ncbi:MAG: hypothetical protein MJ237_07475 [bacterium]|nr:hypothetical protein [bacterium]
MALTLLDLYNTTASQEWAMYDNDATSTDELEKSLVVAINKAVIDILSSYDFPFRERTHIILTIPKINSYPLPNGLIKKDVSGNYQIKYNGQLLSLSSSLFNNAQFGIPNEFNIKNDKIIFNPCPIEKGVVSIDYTTLAIGENSDGKEIFSLQNADDIVIVPEYLEELLKEAIITRTMLNSIASETDENYSAYKKQANNAYKLLIKYSKGVWQDKIIKYE